MYDLLLNDKGDISFEVIDTTKKALQVDFVISNLKALQVNFLIENTEDKQYESGLMINFNIVKLYNDKKEVGITDVSLTEQMIRIRLNTVLGTLTGNEDIGSKIQLLKHKFVDDKNVESDLKKYIAQALVDIIDDPIIYINKSNTSYLDYTNQLNIIIIDNDKQYQYSLL